MVVVGAGCGFVVCVVLVVELSLDYAACGVVSDWLWREFRGWFFGSGDGDGGDGEEV